MVLVAMAVAAALGGAFYWHFAAGPLRAPGEAAGSTAFNEQTALPELADLEQRVDAALQQDRPQAVYREVQRFVERYPKFAPAYRLLGQVLVAQERRQAAYDQFKLSLELDAAQPQVHLLAGTLCMALGQTFDAENHYQQAAVFDPSNVKIRLHLAQWKIEQKRFDQARADLLQLLQADSSLHTAYGMLADMSLMQNKPILALGYIRKAIDNTTIGERDRQVIYVYRMARILRRQNRPDEALQTLQSRLSSLEQCAPAAVEEMALCWSMQGQFERAAMSYERALQKQPTKWRLAAGAARWWLRAADASRAEAQIRYLRQLNPTLPIIAELEDGIERQKSQVTGQGTTGQGTLVGQ